MGSLEEKSVPQDDTILVIFTCHGCGLQRCQVHVRKRRRSEPILDWMEVVKLAVSNRHSFLSPVCSTGKCDLAVSAPKEGDGIGMSMQVNLENLKLPEMDSKGAN